MPQQSPQIDHPRHDQIGRAVPAWLVLGSEEPYLCLPGLVAGARTPVVVGYGGMAKTVTGALRTCRLR